jgi:cyclase
MLLPRIIPLLLLQNGGVVKTVRFKNPTYIGDPINAVKIFNDKGADELMVIDLDASQERADLARVKEMAAEAFMPVTYGGGIRTLSDIERSVKCGVEKVVINTAAALDFAFIRAAARAFGSSTIVVSVDYRKTLLRAARVCMKRGNIVTAHAPLDFARHAEEAGAGELLLHSVDRDGTMTGYDVALLKTVAQHTLVPVTVCGGAKSLDDLSLAFANGASAAAAGSLFVFTGPHRAVLISYPDDTWRRKQLHAH